MSQSMAIEVMQLEMRGLPDLFDEKQLRQRAQAMLADLSRLLDVERLLLHTTLTYRFRLSVQEGDAINVLLVVGLTPRPQLLLDFMTPPTTLGALEREMLSDRQRLRHACQELPVQNTHAAIALAQRLQAGFLDLPEATLGPETERQLTALVNARNHHWSGHLAEDDPWQLELPTLPRYQWRSEHNYVRARLHRERRGFTLILLRRTALPPHLRHVKTLRMPNRPSTLEDASRLDRAEYTGTPLNLVIRVGNVIGSESLSVAAFVRLGSSSTETYGLLPV